MHPDLAQIVQLMGTASGGKHFRPDRQGHTHRMKPRGPRRRLDQNAFPRLQPGPLNGLVGRQPSDGEGRSGFVADGGGFAHRQHRIGVHNFRQPAQGFPQQRYHLVAHLEVLDIGPQGNDFPRHLKPRSHGIGRHGGIETFDAKQIAKVEGGGSHGNLHLIRRRRGDGLRSPLHLGHGAGLR